MANKTIFTGVFRASGIALEAPSAYKPTDEPKFQVQAMFPKTGVCTLNQQPICDWSNIFAALDEVCLHEFGHNYQTMCQPGMGITYPPQLADGDQKLKKDSNGNPIPGEINDITKGHWLIRFKNADAPGVADPQGQDIDPKSVYSGCWGRAQIEVSAYKNKEKQPVLACKLLNFQMCYDDTPIGGRGPKQAASEAFKDMAVTDSNITPGTHAPHIPAANATPAAPAQKKLVAVPGAQYTIEACQQAGWTEEQMIAGGVAQYEEVAAAPAPAAPNAPASPAVPGSPSVPAAPGTPAPPTGSVPNAAPSPAVTQNAGAPAPVTPPAAPAPANQAPAPNVPNAPTVPTQGTSTPVQTSAPAPAANPAPPTPPAPAANSTVKMKPGSQYTYEALKQAGYTDQQMIDAGYADPDFTQ